jgi:hypothetical protein
VNCPLIFAFYLTNFFLLLDVLDDLCFDGILFLADFFELNLADIVLKDF